MKSERLLSSRAAREKTLDMLAANLNEVAAVARDLGQQIALEAHGTPGALENMKYVMDRVKDKKAGRTRLNSEARNAVDPCFEAQYAPIKDVVSPAMHVHNLKAWGYPYQLVLSLMAKAGWNGCEFPEVSARSGRSWAASLRCQRCWRPLAVNL